MVFVPQRVYKLYTNTQIRTRYTHGRCVFYSCSFVWVKQGYNHLYYSWCSCCLTTFTIEIPIFIVFTLRPNWYGTSFTCQRDKKKRINNQMTKIFFTCSHFKSFKLISISCGYNLWNFAIFSLWIRMHR